MNVEDKENLNIQPILFIENVEDKNGIFKEERITNKIVYKII